MPLDMGDGGKGARCFDIRNVAVVEGERSLIRSDVAQDIADCSKGGENEPVEGIGEGENPGRPALPPHTAAGEVEIIHGVACFF
jgi:hypothetical protein